MILGIGTDIIETGRIREAIERHGQKFLERLFTEEEIAYCRQYTHDPTLRFAGRFAAKEAIVKAFGTGLSWKDIEVRNNTFGKPEVHLSPKMRQTHPGAHVLVSISHCESYATATAILIEQG